MDTDIAPPAPRNWSRVGNGMVGGEGRYFDLRADRAARESQVQADLTNEFAQALLRHPSITVRTPGFGPAHPRSSVVDVMLDSFNEPAGEAVLSELLQIAVAAAQRGDVRALEWVARTSAAFGKAHVTDAIEQEG